MRRTMMASLAALAMCGQAKADDVALPEGYICVEQKSTGFDFRDGDWRESSFDVGEKYNKHIIKRRTASAGGNLEYSVWSLATQKVEFDSCSAIRNKMFICYDDVGVTFLFNLETNRFQLMTGYPYLLDVDKKTGFGGTSLAIGICEPIPPK